MITQELLEKTALGSSVDLSPMFDGLCDDAANWVLVKKYNASSKRWFLLDLYLWGCKVSTYRISCKDGVILSGGHYASK